MPSVLSFPPDELLSAPRRASRRWRDKVREAARGIKTGVRGHSSFFVHFFCAALVIAAAAALQCAPMEWAILSGCIGAVLTAELFNSAIETLFHGLDDTTRRRLRGVLDVAAGAVLCAGVTAAVVGGIVIGNRLWLTLS